VRIAFLIHRSAARVGPAGLSPLTAEIVTRLRDGGARIDLITPEDGPWHVAALRPQHDLYVLKAKTPLTLSLAGTLAMGGAAVVNSVWSCTLARDKIAATALLAGGGVPVPLSWTTGRTTRLLPLLEEGPLWLKPHRGSQGAGVRRVDTPAGLDVLPEVQTDPFGLPWPLFAQREVPSGGHDLKVYVVGHRLWAIARRFPARSLQDKIGTPAVLPPQVRRAALACGRVLGLELYGVDVLSAGDRFCVVDVNAFPGYKGVAEAPRQLAAYLYARARQPHVSIS
jgi:ribosomal protein S6--L-glutamate ligase